MGRLRVLQCGRTKVTKVFHLRNELIGLLLTGEDQQSQADQPNSLAEGPPM
jgi:hypothetical protein